MVRRTYFALIHSICGIKVHQPDKWWETSNERKETESNGKECDNNESAQNISDSIKIDVPWGELTVEELIYVIGQYIAENPKLSKKRAAKRIKKKYKLDIGIADIKRDERFKSALEVIRQIHTH